MVDFVEVVELVLVEKLRCLLSFECEMVEMIGCCSL